MRGTVKHIVLVILVVALVLFFLIPAVRRMEPQKDMAPPRTDTTSAAEPERPDSVTVRDERETPARRPGAAAPDGWSPVASWEGIGGRTTERVEINGHTWRIRWEAERLINIAGTQFEVLVFDDRGGVRAIAASANAPDRGTSTLSGPGTFTLQVTTLQKWSLKLEEKG